MVAIELIARKWLVYNELTASLCNAADGLPGHFARQTNVSPSKEDRPPEGFRSSYRPRPAHALSVAAR